MSGNTVLSSGTFATVRMTLGYRCMRQSHSNHLQLQKLHELKEEFNIEDTATLVSAYNEARASYEHHDELLRWIGSYIAFFERETSSESCHDAMEFARLANIIPKGPSEIRLLEDAFSVLCRKIHWGDYGERKLTEAFNYFLSSVDCKVFAGNSHPLTTIARDLMKKLGPEQTFSRGTYPTHSISLLALHRVCAVIHEVDPSEIDHDKGDGLHQEMKRCLQNIINTQRYYPFYYQATMVLQNLANLDSNDRVSFKERWYRLFCWIKGAAYFGQALFGAIYVNFDIESLEKGIKEWSKGCSRRRIKKSSLYKKVQPLINSRVLVYHDQEKIETFKKCLSTIVESLDDKGNKENQRALRFTIIDQVTLLAFECHSKKVKEYVGSELYYLGKCCAPQKGWAKDPMILEALVRTVVELSQNVHFRLHMERVLATIGFYVGKGKLIRVIKLLKKGAQWREENKETSSSPAIGGCESLFNKVKKDMLLDESLSARGASQSMLKNYYQQHSKEASLFENEPSTYVNTLDHSLLLYEKVFAPNGQVHVVKKPIALGDIFKKRQLNPGNLTNKVKRVLLFGNPGTGKTTIAKKIAYQWSIDEWGHAFDMLYLVPVRELSSNKYDDSTMRKQRNLQTAITNTCFFGESDENYEALRFQVKEDLDKESTLVIFDGLDEGDEMTKEMIVATESKSCRVMVLSRPQNLHSERNLALASVEVECMGLGDEQLVKFIESKCSSAELVDHLQRHPSVWELAHIPVVANILVFLYKFQKQDIVCEDSSLNMCSLYSIMSQDIWDRYVEKTKSECRRDQIFEALEELAFRALEDGQILINQHLVRNVCRDRQTSEVLKDSGFLLLKRECVYYQFPHLSFQEFFAGQYMAHSLLSRDERRRQEAIEFLKENKYCANFMQVFRFMTQALTLKQQEEGYLEVESIVNDGPIALGYQQHLLLTMELLEASLSASRPEVRERIVDSTELLKRAFDWIELRECYKDVLIRTVFSSEINPLLVEAFGLPNDESTEEFTKLFVQIARVTRYVPGHWEKLMKIWKTSLNKKNGTKAVLCIVPLMRAIPEKRCYLLDLYWNIFSVGDKPTLLGALSQLSDIASLIPSESEQVFKRLKDTELVDGTPLMRHAFAVDFPRLAELMPTRWTDILAEIKTTCLDDQEVDDRVVFNQIGRLVELVPESKNKVMKLIRELSASDKQSKERMARSCLKFITAMPENATEIAEIVWSLCEDDEKDLCNAARMQVVRIMLAWGGKADAAIDALLKLSKGGSKSIHSSLVQLFALAFKLIEETHEGVDCLLSSLSQEHLETLWHEVALCIRDLIGTKMEKETGLHWLHFMIIKAVKPPEVDVQELRTMMDNVNSDPIKTSVMSANCMTIAKFPVRRLAPMSLCKLVICCPECEEGLFNYIDKLSQDGNDGIEKEACIQAFSLLEKLPHEAERVINWLQKSLLYFKCFHFVRMRQCVSLESLLEAYMICHHELLVFLIVWQLLDRPVTMETRSNGITELIVQISSNHKKRYRFQTVEKAKAFASSFDECIEVVFPDVASLVPKLDSQQRKQSNNSLFANLRVRLTTPFW